MTTAEAAGLPEGEPCVFVVHFDWSQPNGTTLHKHNGGELVLVRSGRLDAVVDGRLTKAVRGQYIDLPAGSVHAIWTDSAAGFDAIGQQGLGLTMIVPDGQNGTREVPIYGDEGPWAQQPPPGRAFTPAEEVDRLRQLSRSLLPRLTTG